MDKKISDTKVELSDQVVKIFDINDLYFNLKVLQDAKSNAIINFDDQIAKLQDKISRAEGLGVVKSNIDPIL